MHFKEKLKIMKVGVGVEKEESYSDDSFVPKYFYSLRGAVWACGGDFSTACCCWLPEKKDSVVDLIMSEKGGLG